MKRVFIGRGVTEAHLVRAFLENAGIGAVVRGEDLSTVFGGIPIDGDSLPSVWILDDDDYDPALELVQESSRTAESPEADDSNDADWQCQQCGESVDGTFLVCWNCGAERGADGPSQPC